MLLEHLGGAKVPRVSAQSADCGAVPKAYSLFLCALGENRTLILSLGRICSIH